MPKKKPNQADQKPDNLYQPEINQALAGAIAQLTAEVRDLQDRVGQLEGWNRERVIREAERFMWPHFTPEGPSECP